MQEELTQYRAFHAWRAGSPSRRTLSTVLATQHPRSPGRSPAWFYLDHIDRQHGPFSLERLKVQSGT